MNVASGQYLHVPLSPVCPARPNHDFFFQSLKQNHFEIAISCFDKVYVGNSTLTLTAACVVLLYVTHNQVYVTFTATQHRTACERTDVR